ncbi:MAG: TIGR03792 family protein [Prochlorothrix sp.]|nr:TIGR03792 family protein [Prochlorothrix sp.]
MVIEWLEFRVDPAVRSQFLHHDRQIWTTALSTCPGYHSKEVWQDHTDPRRIVMVIRWQSRDQWKAIDPLWLETLETQFRAAVGEHYTLETVREFSL